MIIRGNSCSKKQSLVLELELNDFLHAFAALEEHHVGVVSLTGVSRSGNRVVMNFVARFYGTCIGSVIKSVVVT